MLLKDRRLESRKAGKVERDTKRNNHEGRKRRASDDGEEEMREGCGCAEDKRREERRVYRRAVPPLARSEFIARVISIHKR